MGNQPISDATCDLPARTLAREPEVNKPGFTEIRVRGKTIQVPSICIKDCTLIIAGNWLKVAAAKDEDLLDRTVFERPEVIIEELKRSHLGADLFTFAQQLPDTEPKHPFRLEWDNAAVVPITTYKDWLEKRVEYDVRKAIKKSAKLGVVVKSVPFSDTLVQGIVDIYSESSIRQGKAFWHYGKDFATVKLEAGTYLEKCEFIGAYFADELIGFIKMAHLGKITATIHVIAKKQHFDKKATNTLLAKAVEICEQRGSTHLIYGNYIYHDPASSLTEFKRRNGFEMVLLPRYYVPLNIKGQLALKLGLHHGLGGILPERVRKLLIKARTQLHTSFQKSAKTEATPARRASAPHPGDA